MVRWSDSSDICVHVLINTRNNTLIFYKLPVIYYSSQMSNDFTIFFYLNLKSRIFCTGKLKRDIHESESSLSHELLVFTKQKKRKQLRKRRWLIERSIVFSKSSWAPLSKELIEFIRNRDQEFVSPGYAKKK